MRTHINLLPLEIRRRHIVRLRLRPWGAVWFAVAALLATLTTWDWQDAQSAARKRMVLEQQLAPTQALEAANAELAKQIDLLEKRESVALALSNERPILSLLGMIGKASQAAEGRVYVQQLQWNETPQAVGAPSAAASAIAMLRLQGVGLDNLSIARFAAALRDANVFSQVQVNASNAVSDPAEAGRSYAIECTF
jgi:hypothetical protein